MRTGQNERFCSVQIDKLYNCVYILSYQFILIKRTGQKAFWILLFFNCRFLLYCEVLLPSGITLWPLTGDVNTTDHLIIVSVNIFPSELR